MKSKEMEEQIEIKVRPREVRPGTNAPGSVLPLWGRRPLGGGPAPRYPASAAEGSALRPPQPVSDGSRGLETRR